MKAFLLNFLVGVGFCWRTVSTYFWVKNPGGCTKSRFPEDLRTGQLGGEAFVWRCVYLFVCLFVCLFVVCLSVCFLFDLRGLFVGSCVDYVVWCRWCGWGWVWGWLFLWSFVAVLVGLLWLVVFSCAFDAGCYERLAFIFNLLLLLSISLYTIVKCSFCV